MDIYDVYVYVWHMSSVYDGYINGHVRNPLKTTKQSKSSDDAKRRPALMSLAALHLETLTSHVSGEAPADQLIFIRYFNTWLVYG